MKTVTTVADGQSKTHCGGRRKSKKRRAFRSALTEPKSNVNLRFFKEEQGRPPCPFKQGECCNHPKPGACEECPVFLKNHPRSVLI